MFQKFPLDTTVGHE